MKLSHAFVHGMAAIGAMLAGTPSTGLLFGHESAEHHEHHKHPANELAKETSPYLLQHAHNPVKWRPWGPEALALAAKENKPIFLSVGYSTCYWCHVMERESFEDEEVAAILNRDYIPIKVDREERPELDEQYMLATQLLRGSGGWPNSVWLTPDGRPWMAGTYFPKATFMQVLTTLAKFWDDDREAVENQANIVAEAIKKHAAGKDLAVATGEPSAQSKPKPRTPREQIEALVEQLHADLDAEHGGFGGAPKFPPHGELRLLLDEHDRSPDAKRLSIVTSTLDGMIRGGVRDHLGGGFHRYSTDAEWLLPHFEKMLYDNAQLLETLARTAAATGNAEYRQAAAEIVSWLQREMTGPEGGFYSAQDSESEGVEGKSYVWTVEEIVAALGPEDGAWLAKVYGAVDEGNYKEERSGERTGANVLHLPRSLAEIAAEEGIEPGEAEARAAALCEKLLAERGKRAAPRLDDKMIASWNGLMIGALSRAGRALEKPQYIELAKTAAEALLANLVVEGQLHRTWRGGQVRQPAYLEDYAFVGRGLLDLHEATGDARWLHESRKLADVVLAEFQDEADGGFFFTSTRHETPLGRSKNLFGGGNTPLPAGVAAEWLTRLGRIQPASELSTSAASIAYAKAAQRTLESLGDFMRDYPRSADSLLAAAILAEESNPPDAARVAQVDPRELKPPATLPLDPAPSKPDALDDAKPVTSRVYLSQTEVLRGQKVAVAISLSIDKGWHLYGPNPGNEFVLPSTVKVVEGKLLSKLKATDPEPERALDPVLKEELEVFTGEVWFLAEAEIAADAPGGKNFIEVKIKTQACDEKLCMPPVEVTLKAPITVSATAAQTPRHAKIFARFKKDAQSPNKSPQEKKE